MPKASDGITIGTRATIEYSLEEALAVIVGFAFGTDLAGAPYSADRQYRYAFRSYDCALLTTGAQVSEADVFASAGLNSGINADVILRILAVLDNTVDLPNLSAVPDFWTLDVGRLNVDPGAGWPEHELWRWYQLLTRLDGVAGAVAAKIVHHKHPTVMPLWDSYIGRAYHSGETWGEICLDLQRNEEWFLELERRFEHYRLTFQGERGVPLKRLRLLDILVWCHVGKDREHVMELGQPLILAASDPDGW